jgi:hypothetical protein
VVVAEEALPGHFLGEVPLVGVEAAAASNDPMDNVDTNVNA